MKKGLIAGISACVVAAAVLLAVLIPGTKKHEEIDLSSHTTAAAETVKETMAPTEAVKETEAVPTAGTIKPSEKVSASVERYAKNSITIEYPVLAGLSDENKLASLNKHLKENALSIIKAFGIDQTKDTADIRCTVISADRSRVVVTYKGSVDMARSEHPSNVFYSNTVDLPTGQDIGFSRYADAYTMAGYVMSDNVELAGGSAITAAEFKSLRDELGFEYYYDVLKNADFPFEKVFPESFSYTEGDAIYFSLPVSHEAGDYVIAVFRPEGK